MVILNWFLIMPGRNIFIGLFFLVPIVCHSYNIKFLVEDFEGMGVGQTDLQKEGLFKYGQTSLVITDKNTTGMGYSGRRALAIYNSGAFKFGGFGLSVHRNIEVDQQTDFLNFYFHSDHTFSSIREIKLTVQEDDDMNDEFQMEKDDLWVHELNLDVIKGWNLISVPLKLFSDENLSGDGVFNIGYRSGKLFNLIFSFKDETEFSHFPFYVDFINFSEGKMNKINHNIFEPEKVQEVGNCMLGAWSEEGNDGKLESIPKKFEGIFNQFNSKRLGVVHFFQPFSSRGNKYIKLIPSSERISGICENGYIPLITLENHFVNPEPGEAQPDLTSITHGLFDEFLDSWAREIKKVRGIVYLRILHEFNGDWYPWSVAKNKMDPALYVDAFRHIYLIFKRAGVKNVRFIWCPNSMSIPQVSWNCILEAYPGNQYVDIIGLDVYNGAGNNSVWKSFRFEATENYFLIRKNFPRKPIILAEISSRERVQGEGEFLLQKSDWIRDMSEALKSDFSAIKLISWFNEYDTFKVNSSDSARDSYLEFILNDAYFQNGTLDIFK